VGFLGSDPQGADCPRHLDECRSDGLTGLGAQHFGEVADRSATS
jgi:hypothetical protein